MLPTSFAPQILITGSTGFLGGALAADLLDSAEWPSVLLLVRAANANEAFDRAVRSLRRFVTDPRQLNRLERHQVLHGDFTEPGAFIEDERLPSIRRVVHCAALTSFGTTNRSFTVNVDGTLRFVHHLRQVATIERFLHVSTAMICGSRPSRLVREEDYPRTQVEHLVNYTESKAEAERLLRLTLPGFPLVVVRPSIIVGHTRLGCAPSGSIFWTFRVADALGMITCREDSRIDVIPVDYAARALRLLLVKPRLAHDSYHISSGEAGSCSWEELGYAFSRARGADDTNGSARGLRSVELHEIEARKPQFDQLFGNCNKLFMMKAIRLYGNFAGLDTVFSNDRMQAEGMEPPPRFSEYLNLCQGTSSEMTISDQMLVDFQ
jgi:nucleoside-diphosphate-sugar epimerase